MPRELKNAVITHVSYVGKAANQKKFFLTKSADQPPTFQKEVRLITKADDAQKLVYGLVYEPNVPDAHNDIMTAVEIEKAAHRFIKDARNIDEQHDFTTGSGEVVESYIAPVDFEINGESIQKGSWVLVTKASDEVWEAIQKGEYTGYSMAGVAETIEHDEEPQMKSFFRVMKDFFAGKTAVQKGAVRDKYQQGFKSRNFWAAMTSFEDTIRSYNWHTDTVEFTQDDTVVREALQDFNEIMTELLLTENIVKAIGVPTTDIQKAGKKISTTNMQDIDTAIAALQALKDRVSDEEEEDEVMKAEDIQKAITAALEPVVKEVEDLKKAVAPQPQEPTVDETAAAIQDAIAKALEPIVKDIEAIKAARGVSKQLEDPTQVQKSEGNSYSRYFG